MRSKAHPFHLRPNKHIDRRLFVESLQLLSHIHNVREYGYISLGGPFLEDARIMYADLGISRLMSIERSENEYRRQTFNVPLPFITCEKCDVNSLVANFESKLELIKNPEHVIVWLDYQDTQRGTQLDDVRALAPKLGAFDIVRVTMNASQSDSKATEVVEATPTDAATGDEATAGSVVLDKIRTQLGPFFPEGASEKDVVDRALPALLSRAIYSAFKEGIGEGLEVVSVTNLSYRDGQQMLTVTVTLWPGGDEAALLLKAGLDTWPFYSPTAADVHRIDVPTMTLRERTEIDRLLEIESMDRVPEDLRQIFDDSDLEQYQKYRRYYPTYARVAV